MSRANLLKKLFILLILIGIISICFTSVASSDYPPDKSSASCFDCHADVFNRLGLHYDITYSDLTNSDYCDTCHTVHEASNIEFLFPEKTQSKICFACHNGTIGDLDNDTNNNHGIYGEVSNADIASGMGARHTIDIITEAQVEITGSLPGISVFGTITVPYGTDLSKRLDCSSCHTPHARNLITTNFPSKNTRNSVHLLKQYPGDATVAVTSYGAKWCASCHQDAMNGVAPGMYDHPMSQVANYSYPLDPGVTPTPANQPLCMSCHDDARNVANFPVHNEGAVTLDNFPHESTNNKFLIETGDNLCLNCHGTSSLP